MSQSDSGQGQYGVIEQSHGEYSVRIEGNSVTVTVPRAFPIEAGTEIVLRTGWVNDKLIYLKAIPMESLFNQLPTGTPETEANEKITENKIGIYRVRGGCSEKKSVTIPKKCDTERFPEKSQAAVVSGRCQAGLAYLKLFPEYVHSEVETLTIREIMDTVIENDC